MFLVVCGTPAPPWRRNGTPVPIIHVRRRWLAQRHWQCECHWPASNRLGGWRALSVAFDGKIWLNFQIFIRNQWIQTFVSCFLLVPAGGVRPGLHFDHSMQKDGQNALLTGGFPPKKQHPNSPIWWFCRVTPAALSLPSSKITCFGKKGCSCLGGGQKSWKKSISEPRFGKKFLIFRTVFVAWVWLFASVFNLFCHSELSWLSYSLPTCQHWK